MPDTRFAMRLSLAAAVLMLAGKWAAYALTGSAAILADALESVVHTVAVAFAAFSLALSDKPADNQFLYGYERISFFSAGFEGAMIVLAGLATIIAAVQKWLGGLTLLHLGTGTALVAAAGAINGLLGWYLVWTGRRQKSLILEANGKHVLTDCWTSAGVVGGLLLVLATGWKPFDPILAILVGTNVLWSGGGLMARSVRGLMDFADPATAAKLRRRLDALVAEYRIDYHGLRFRSTGRRLIVELHLLFPYDWKLGEAHRIATAIEERLADSLDVPAQVVTHLESVEDHGHTHSAAHYEGKAGA